MVENEFYRRAFVPAQLGDDFDGFRAIRKSQSIQEGLGNIANLRLQVRDLNDWNIPIMDRQARHFSFQPCSRKIVDYFLKLSGKCGNCRDGILNAGMGYPRSPKIQFQARIAGIVDIPQSDQSTQFTEFPAAYDAQGYPRPTRQTPQQSSGTRHHRGQSRMSGKRHKRSIVIK